MPGLDPLSLGLSGAQTLIGIGQSIFGGIREHKAIKALEAQKTPTYNPNKSILDYYNTALQRYNVNPYQSQQYQNDTQNASRNTAAGVGALQDRRSAIGGISRLTAIQNNSNLQAGINAENSQNQRFSQLGQATGMRSADDRYGFQINSLMPYEKQRELLGLKASGGANIMNAGLSNIFGGLSSASMIAGDQRMNRQQSGNGYQQQPSIFNSNQSSWGRIGL
jgi:hypothetical protein